MTTYGKLLVALGVLILVAAVGAYFLLIHHTQAPVVTSVATTTLEVATTTPPSGKLVARNITWKLTPTEDDAQGTPHTEVSVTVDGTEHVAGTFAGECKDITAAGSIDGKGLVAGELSAVQCYWAGSGDEIGVFANEDGGYDIMVGDLAEPTAETKGVRGNFRVIGSQSSAVQSAVTLHTDGTASHDDETIELDSSASSGPVVDLTGWTIRSTTSGTSVVIGKTVSSAAPYSTYPANDVVFEPAAVPFVIIHTGGDPKQNKATVPEIGIRYDLYLGLTKNLWGDVHDSIELVDTKGRVQASVTY